MKKTILLLLTLIFCAGINAQNPTNGGFENGIIDWTAASGTATTTSTNARTGASSYSHTTSSTSNVAHTNPTVISVINNSYAHVIGWAIGSNASSRASLGGTLNGTTSSTTIQTIGTTLTRLIHTSTQNTTGAAVNFTCRFNTRSVSGSTTLYYDDIVMYTSTSSTPDTISPTSATGFTTGSNGTNSLSFSWANGTDAGTGIQNTIILRTTNTSASTPTLNNQGVYSTSGGVNGPNTVNTVWTVLSTTVSGTSYTDNTVTTGVTYKYAVIHRDLAYNYSAALVSGSIVSLCNPLILTSSSKSSLTRQCILGTVIYYGDNTGYYFAIDTSGITSGALTGDTVSITVGNFDSSKSSNGSNQEHAMYLLNRYWNAKGSFTGTVKVQFPYSPADTATLAGFRDNAWTQLTTVTNTNSFAKKNAKLEWFKTVGVDYGSSVITGIVGNKFPVSAGIIKPTFTYGTAGSTNYVELQGIASFSGGSAGFSYGPNNGSGGNGLPVTWVSIDAGHTETGNRVDWSTASEKNNDYFLVESSFDAITWKVESSKIEPKDTTGNNASLSEYNWTHLGNNEKMYYRIKQVDLDGKYDYSKVAYANKSAKAPAGILSTETEPYLIYPNPASGSVTIAGYANTDVTIMDNVGRIVLHHRMSQTKQVLDISILAPGIYSVGLADLQRNNIFKKLIIE